MEELKQLVRVCCRESWLQEPFSSQVPDRDIGNGRYLKGWDRKKEKRVKATKKD